MVLLYLFDIIYYVPRSLLYESKYVPSLLNIVLKCKIYYAFIESNSCFISIIDINVVVFMFKTP